MYITIYIYITGGKQADGHLLLRWAPGQDLPLTSGTPQGSYAPIFKQVPDVGARCCTCPRREITEVDANMFQHDIKASGNLSNESPPGPLFGGVARIGPGRR